MAEGLGGFKLFVLPQSIEPEYMKLEAWGMLTTRFGKSITNKKLKSLGSVLSYMLNLNFGNKHMQNTNTLVSWFEKHKKLLFPFIDAHMIILGENKEIIFG